MNGAMITNEQGLAAFHMIANTVRGDFSPLVSYSYPQDV
jgi:hypothetical protein